MSTPVESRRYHALDCVRAAAMLLGVLYHALMFGAMGRGGPGPGFGGIPMRLQEWMHSFRMPLFFLISGFFSAMMLEKYGPRGYLSRRWSRIGLPLVVGLLTFVPLDQAIRGALGGPGGGPPGAGRPGPPPGGGPAFDRGFERGGPADAPAGPEGFGPPGRGPRRGGPGEFDMPGGGGGPGRRPFGFGPRPSPIGDAIFGAYSRYFRLEYLWFLWYLLVFATITPVLAKGLRVVPESIDQTGRGLLARNFAPMLLGLAATPALMATSGMFGWSLGLASGIFSGVPDFVFQYQPDMPFYFIHFLAGWWLYRVPSGLSEAARHWPSSLVVGLVGHIAASALSSTFAMRTDMPYYNLIRIAGYTTYALGGAYTAFGVLGLFQRTIDRPTRAGRYLADTAFWVYLVHLPLLTPILTAVRRFGLPWWVQAPLVALATTASALLLFELLIRPTPLVRLFGPAARRRPESSMSGEMIPPGPDVADTSALGKRMADEFNTPAPMH